MLDHERHPFALRLLPPPAALVGGRVVRDSRSTEPNTSDAIRRDLDALVGNRPDHFRSVDQIGISDLVPNHPDAVGVVADAARTLHLRRQLARAADHAAALLPALGLPRLVGDGFVPIDLAAAGDAIDAAVAALDALDGDTDIEDGGEAEPSLGWVTSAAGVMFLGGGSDLEDDESDREAVNEDGDDLDRGEHDTTDQEPTIGWPEDPMAVVAPVYGADMDCEADGADLEDGDEDEDWRGDPSERLAAVARYLDRVREGARV